MLEGESPEVRPRYLEAFAHRRMPMDYARLVWRRYISAGTDSIGIPTFEEHDSLIQHAGRTTSAAMAKVEVSAGRFPSRFVVPNDK